MHRIERGSGTGSNGTAEEEGEPQTFVADKQFARHIESALLPLRSYLSARQAEIVRSVLGLSIEGDPVSRELAQGAVRTHLAMIKPTRGPNAPRISGGDVTPSRDRVIKK